MPQITEETKHDSRADVATDPRKNAKQRAKLKASLNDIADEVTRSLQEVGIAIPVFFTVPSGGPLMTFATETDPADEVWARVSEIVVLVVSRALFVDDLIYQSAPCAAATAMACADLLMSCDPVGTDP
jgi:hypothetical protein